MCPWPNPVRGLGARPMGSSRAKRRRCGRPAIDTDLPVRRVEHDLSEQDKAGFERCTRIGEQTSRMLEYTPARLEIIETVRATYRCEGADGSVTVRTRLQLAREALVALVTEYFNQAQNVSITLITFSGTATVINAGAPE